MTSLRNDPCRDEERLEYIFLFSDRFPQGYKVRGTIAHDNAAGEGVGVKNGQRKVEAPSFGVGEMLRELRGRRGVPFTPKIESNVLPVWVKGRFTLQLEAYAALFV